MSATTIPQLSDSMQAVLGPTADRLARETGFVRRERNFSGSTFTQTLVFSWLAQPDATLEEMSQTAAALGVKVSAQGLDQRFTPKAATFLQRVLRAVVEEEIVSDPVIIPAVQRFEGVYLLDGSTLSLPQELAALWPGCGSSHGPNAVLKLSVLWDYSSGSLRVDLQAGREHDRSSPSQQASLPAGSLRLADLGYFSLARLAELDEEGVYWLSRVQARTAVFDKTGRRWELAQLLEAQGADEVDLQVELGREERLPCRLLAQRVPDQLAQERRRKIRAEARRRGQTPSRARLQLADWTILVTNGPQAWLGLAEALVLYRVRWQIELLFKLWKQQGQLSEWRTENPWRILCEIYAKLIALVVQHWILVVSCWRYADRSLYKAAQTVRKHALHLASVFSCWERLCQALEVIENCLRVGCRINRRKSRPHTYQSLLALTGGLT